MTEHDLLVETLRQVMEKHEPILLSSTRRWDEDLWRELANLGLTGVGVPEELGGSAGTLQNAATVVAEVARGGGAVPLAEHLLVALPMLQRVGLPLGDLGRVTTCSVEDGVVATVDAGDWRISGTACVPWLEPSTYVILLASGPSGPMLARVDSGSLPAAEHRGNIADEPRAHVQLDSVPCQARDLDPGTVQEFRSRLALARAVQISAALDEILAWTVQYARERHQFGRALGSFQAIQMDLALAAGEVSAVAASVDAAVWAMDADATAWMPPFAAKVRAASAVECVARTAHQVHGAIGFTQEHKLQHLTRRVWSWRDEGGTERELASSLGQGLCAASSNLRTSVIRSL